YKTVLKSLHMVSATRGALIMMRKGNCSSLPVYCPTCGILFREEYTIAKEVNISILMSMMISRPLPIIATDRHMAVRGFISLTLFQTKKKAEYSWLISMSMPYCLIFWSLQDPVTLESMVTILLQPTMPNG